MSDAFEQIKALLPSLTAEELADVKGRCAFLAQAGGNNARTKLSDGKPAPESDDIELILSEIAGHLKEQGIDYVSMQSLRAVGGYGEFAKKVPATMIFFRKVTTNRVRLRALIRLAIIFLFKDLSRMGLAATTRTMMAHWHRAPAVINSQFPGYAQAGLLGLILRQPMREFQEAKYVKNEGEIIRRKE